MINKKYSGHSMCGNSYLMLINFWALFYHICLLYSLCKELCSNKQILYCTPLQELLDASHLVEVKIACFMILRYCPGKIYQKRIIWTKKGTRPLLIISMRNFSSWRIWWRHR